ncbi:MAG TPA: Rieske 2Fe-2S domain-containing protein [Acidimicrobiales bacterium]|nr:Rieske 2Fe-2S domain-containing protein [Acidimicrobiales bacterium]
MQEARIGSLDELRAKGCLAGKVGSQPVCVFWSDAQAYAVDDRCPHMGFPLHRGSVQDGLLTCHWHHARFDLASGGTLDPFADDVRAHAVEIRGDDVVVTLRADVDPVAHHLHRLEEGLEQGLTLVMAKAVLALVDLMGPADGAAAALRAGVDFGIANRATGWGAGLTVLTAMANVLDLLDPSDRVLALVHGLGFVSRDTRGRPPRFALAPLTADIPLARLGSWYRRFVDTRNGDAAERVVATAAGSGAGPWELADLAGAAITDHVFVDVGHTIDFTNKAFEALEHLGWERASTVLPTLAQQSAAASRSEETGSWRHPNDLAELLRPVQTAGAPPVGAGDFTDEDVDSLAWLLLGDEPRQVVEALDTAVAGGASYEQIARAVSYAAALRLVRFHTQNDHGDWDEVHHGFTTANATHQMIGRAPTPSLARGIYQAALKVFLDRFLNIPAARLPAHHPMAAEEPDLDRLSSCWDQEGMVDEAGAIVYRWVRSGRDQAAAVAALGSALLAEDADFHWYQPTRRRCVRPGRGRPAPSRPPSSSPEPPASSPLTHRRVASCLRSSV